MADTIENDPRFEWIPFYREYAEKFYKQSNDFNIDVLSDILNSNNRFFTIKTLNKYYNSFLPIIALSLDKSVDRKYIVYNYVKDRYNINADVPSDLTGIPRFKTIQPFLVEKTLEFNRLFESVFLVEVNSIVRSRYNVCGLYINKWVLSSLLYLLDPDLYPSLDINVRKYLSNNKLITNSCFRGFDNYDNYLNTIANINTIIKNDGSYFKSFPELTYLAWSGSLDRDPVKSKKTEIPMTEGLITESGSRQKIPRVISKGNKPDATTQSADVKNDESVTNIESPQKINNPKAKTPPAIVQIIKKYEKKDFYKNVIFKKDKDDKSLNSLVAILESKKNIIIQGPPGTGKTHLTKHLAWYMNGSDDRSKVEAVQFHQSYSYEDFMLGNRFIDGKCQLIAGPFLNFCMRARMNHTNKHFFIIDEINRGNLSKIFGEALSLIEASKRGDMHGLRLMYPVEKIDNYDDELNEAYSKLKSEKLFYIPENLYIIGTMNTADKSLAFLDFALRRRFAFYDMKPMFGKKEFNERLEKFPKLKDLADIVEKDLNPHIELTKDEGFLVGHSYFLPTSSSVNEDECIEHILNHELIPLINEYWIDDDASKNKALGFFDKYTKTEDQAK